MFPLPTNRLSPKNQVTLPRDARSLAGVTEGGVVCGLPNRAIHEDPAKRFPIVTLMTVDELSNRELQVRNHYESRGESSFKALNKLNEGLKQMTVDGQRRIVLPPHFVDYLEADKDLLFICTNSTVYVWNPERYLAWRGEPDEQTQLTLDRFLV